jgi:hypothetical protein
VEGTSEQLSALLAAWSGEIRAQPFAHERALHALGGQWAGRQRYLIGVHRVLGTIQRLD